MLSWKNLILAICTFHLVTCGEVLETRSIEKRFHESLKKIRSLIHTNGKDSLSQLVYLNAYNFTVYQCHFNDNGTLTEKSCKVTHEREKGIQIPRFTFAAENAHSVVFSYLLENTSYPESHKLLFKIVEMNSCEINHLTIPINGSVDSDYAIEYTKLLLDLEVFSYFDGSNETYDAFLPNFGESSSYYKMTFDNKGRIISDRVAYLPRDLHFYKTSMYPVDTKASPDDFFAVTDISDSLFSGSPQFSDNLRAKVNALIPRTKKKTKSLLYASKDMKVTELLRIEGTKKSFLNFSTDVSNDRFSLCWHGGSEPLVRCVQYNRQALRVMNTWVEEKELIKALDLLTFNPFKIHYSTEYGLLFLTPSPEKQGLAAIQIKNDGRFGKSWLLPLPGCKLYDLGLMNNIVVSQNHEFCFLIECEYFVLSVQKCFKLN